MAQTDTGLGWSAKSEWLTSAPSVIGIVGTGGVTNPVPVRVPGQITSDNAVTDLYPLGFYYRLYPSNDPAYPLLTSANAGAFPPIGSFIYISPPYAYVVYLSETDPSDLGSTGCAAFTGNPATVIFAASSASSWTLNTSTGFYYKQFQLTTGASYNVGTLPVFNTLQDGLDSFVGSSYNITKTNAGPAVVCNAKWYTDNNVLFTTPILISSETGNVDMTCDSSAYSLAKLNVRYDGVSFYMSFFDIVNERVISSFEEADLSMFNLDLHQVFNLIAQSGMSNIQVEETVDPFHDFPYNGEDAGEINPDPQDDDVDFDDLPTRSFSEGGFCRIFNPDLSDLNDLSSYMWTDQTFLQTVINHLKQILENPIEAIISLSIVPVQPPASATKVPVNVMYFNTGVTMRPVTSQFVTIDCGTTVLQESFGGALDYNPYTRVQMYLPYIGTVQLDTDEVMKKTLHLKYHIDVVTGICCAELKADDKLLYHFSGHCSVSQPITSADFSGYLNAAISAAKLAVGVATGMAASTAAATAAQTPPAPSTPSSDSTSTALVPVPSNQALVPGRGLAPRIQEPPQYDHSKLTALWGELSKPGNLNTAAAAMGGKMVVQHSGGFSGNSGYLAKRRPYLIVTRPRIANPEEYGQHNGRPSMMHLNLGACTGYTQVQSVHLTGFDATNPELSEISTLLKGGVIL